MLNTESRYAPVVSIVISTVAGVSLTSLVTTDLGNWSYVVFALAVMGLSSLWRDGWSAFHRMRLHRRSQDAYEKITRIFKPEIMNPKHPGNQDFMKEQAQQSVDDAAVLMDRFGMSRPANIDVNDRASVEEWYKYLRPLRRNRY